MSELSETVERKFVESYELDDLEIWTDTGWHDVTDLHVTVPYEEWTLVTESGKILHCADTHILFDENMDQVFTQDLIPYHSYIQTETGPELVIELKNSGLKVTMYDLTVDSPDHRFYTNGILSHNTTAYVGYLLWYSIFRDESTVAILANKEKTATKILAQIKKTYELLPLWIQPGIKIWNKTSIEFENGSRLFCSATAASGIRGEAVNLLLLDEFAHVENNVADDFFTSTYPVISSAQTSKVVIVSTPKGMNLFYNMWKNAKRGPGKPGYNEYNPIEVAWNEIPGRDEKWKAREIAQTSPEKFAQEHECEFIGSSNTLIAGQKLATLSYDEPRWVNTEGFRVYDYPVKENLKDEKNQIQGHVYVALVDTSHGIGQDYHTVQVIDVTQMPYVQVATFRNNALDSFSFPSAIHQICNMYNEAWVLIEINDTGKQIADILYNELEYCNIIRVHQGLKGAGGQVAGGWGAGRTNLGVTMSAAVKTTGCANLKSLVEMDKLIIKDANTISELSTFSRGDRKTYEAEYGFHDDLVMPLVTFGWLTGQPFFRDISDVSVRQTLHAKMLVELESEMLPIGYRSNGLNQPEAVVDLGDKNPWQVKTRTPGDRMKIF